MLGLGAEFDPLLPNERGKRKEEVCLKILIFQFKEPMPKKVKVEEKSRIGEYVKILHGRNQGLIGEIIQIKEKADGVAAKIKLLGSTEARVWLDEVVTVSREEVDKVLNKESEITGWVRPRIRIVI